MIRYLFGLFLCFVLFCSAAFGQDCLDYDGFPTQLNCEVVAPGAVSDMCRSGSALFAVNGTELAVYDLTNVAHPTRVLTLDLGSETYGLSASGDLLAVAVDAVGVQLYDISAPATPTLAGTIPAVQPDSYYPVHSVALRGELLVYTEAQQPVRLMDVSDPAAPVELSILDTTAYSESVIEGDLLALAGSDFGLFDISDPSSPVLLDFMDLFSGCPYEYGSVSRPVIQDGFAYAEAAHACNWRNPYIYGDPIVFTYWIARLGAAGTEAAQKDAGKILGNAGTRDAALVGGYLAFEGEPGFHELYELDGAGGVAPASLSLPLMCGYNRLLEIDGQVLAGTDEGLVVTIAPSPELEGYYAGVIGDSGILPAAVQIDGDLALFAYGNYFEIETSQNYYETFLNQFVKVWRGEEYLGAIDFGDYFYCGLTWSRPFVFGDLVVTVWGNWCEEAISPVDITDPEAMAAPPYIVLPGCTDADRAGSHLMLLAEAGGVVPVAMDDPAVPVVLDACLIETVYDDFAIRGDRMYLLDGTILRVADVSDPAAPVLLTGEYTVPAGTLKVADDLLFILHGTQLTWYALAAGDEPLMMGSADVGTEVRDVVFSGALIYYADEFGIGLIGMDDVAPRGRLMAQDASHLVIRGEEILASQTTQSWLFPAPLDCADTVPVFVHSFKAVRDGDRAILGWSVSGSASADDFQVDLRAAGRTQRLPILSDGRGSFRSAATVAGDVEATFSLFLVENGDALLLREETLQPVVTALRTELRGAYPNPFNPRTEIVYRLREAGEAELSVYDLSGRRLAVLASGHQEAGEHSVPWLGCDDAGRALASGSYLARLVTKEGVQSSKLLLLR